MAELKTMFCPACGAVRDVDATKPCSSCGEVPTVIRGGARIVPLTPAHGWPDVSPTGEPLVPPSWVPYVGALTGVALLVSTTATAVAAAVPPAAPVAGVVAAIAGSVGTAGLFVLGLSPGLRRKNGH